MAEGRVGVDGADRRRKTDPHVGTAARESPSSEWVRVLCIAAAVVVICVVVCNGNSASCARGDTYASDPCKLTVSSYLFARCHQLFRQVGYLRHQQQLTFDLLTLKVLSN